MRAAFLGLLVVLGSLATIPVGVAGQEVGPSVGPAVAPSDDSEGGPSVESEAESGPSEDAVLQTEDGPPDPESDVIGWENGIWYNESIPVDQTGLGDHGLTERETELLTARTMARVEYLRGLEFTEPVTVQFVSRATLRDRLNDTNFGETTNDQVYEAIFAYGEDADARTEIKTFLGSAVIGYAAEEGATNLTIVTKDESLHAVEPSVLAHELVHVLQHQQFDLSQERYRRDTLDGEWGKDGLVEGEASYIDAQYSEQCISNWSCVNPPSDWSGASARGAEVYSLLSAQPYTDGGTYVYELVQEGGWEAVNEAHEDPPASSEQIIHRQPNEEPIPLSVEDHSTDEWERYHTNTLGEIGIFGFFFAQRMRAEEGQAVLDRSIFDRQHRWDNLDFAFEPSAGWGNDRFFAYRNGDARGYVWTTVWDSERDAEEFAGAYRQALTGMGAWKYGENTYVIDSGPFADAFYVIRENRTVRIVNAPSVETLEEVDTRVQARPNPYIEHLRERLEEQNETIDRLRDRLEAQNRTIAELEGGTPTGEDRNTTAPLSPAVVVGAVLAAAFLLARRQSR